MLTMKTLEHFINQWDEVITRAQRCGYENLRLFQAPYEEDKNSLHIMGSYNASLRQKEYDSEDMSDSLSEVLQCSVSFWPDNALGIQAQDKEEAAKAPLTDQKKAVEYFVTVIIPHSTDKEATFEETQQAAQLLLQHGARTTYKINAQGKTEVKQPSFFKGERQPVIEAVGVNSKAIDPTLPAPAKDLLEKACDALGNEEAQWQAAEEYIRARKMQKLVSNVTNPV